MTEELETKQPAMQTISFLMPVNLLKQIRAKAHQQSIETGLEVKYTDLIRNDLAEIYMKLDLE